MSNIEHILLYSFLFIMIPLWGYYNNKKIGIKFWISAIMPILLISIIIGCRYWGADYLWYKYQYEHLNSSIVIEEQSSQPIFFLLNKAIAALGFNYVGVFIIYTFIYFIGAFHLLSSYGKASKFMYLFILFPYLIFGTGIIRQSISIGVILFAIPYLDRKEFLKFCILSTIAINIHSSSIILIFTLLGFNLFRQRLLNPIYTIPIYIFISFIYNPADINFIGNIAHNFAFISPKFQGYLDNTDVWFSNEAFQEDFTQSHIALILQSLFICSIFYISYIALRIKINTNIIYIYNMTVIGFIFMRMFFNIELMRRIANPMTLLYPIPLGYSIYIIKKYATHITQNQKRYFQISFFCIIVYLALYWGRFLLFGSNYIFFWNS